MSAEPIDPHLNQITDCLYRISAKAVTTRDNKILLVKEKGEEHWSLPGGGVDYGETITETLKRELSEELSIAQENITVHDQVLHAGVGHVVEQIPRVGLLYRVDLVGEVVKETDHILGFGWFTAEDIETLYITAVVGGKTQLLRYFTD